MTVTISVLRFLQVDGVATAGAAAALHPKSLQKNQTAEDAQSI